MIEAATMMMMEKALYLEGTDRILLAKNGIEGNKFIVPAK